MRRPLLSMRAALVLLLAVLTGLGAGLLAGLGGTPGPGCVLYGAGAFGVAVGFFDRLVGDPDARPAPGGTARDGSDG
ncbi:hypothetical protein [Streptomyces sp. NPDC018031]|uniref:hypothetical protein n=1 Tax=Streptomyces sp. NPDC018031 TaxID=3365033 RepID=UPI00379AF67F